MGVLGKRQIRRRIGDGKKKKKIRMLLRFEKVDLKKD
jgi:hypothetical protein